MTVAQVRRRFMVVSALIAVTAIAALCYVEQHPEQSAWLLPVAVVLFTVMLWQLWVTVAVLEDLD